jgi:hypothetical protein
MDSMFPVDRVKWVAIEPEIITTIECLSRKLKALQDAEGRAAAIKKRLQEKWEKTKPSEPTPEEAKPPVEANERDIELKDGSHLILFEDTDWRSQVKNLLSCLRLNNLGSTVEIIGSHIPPWYEPCPMDLKGSAAELIHYREREKAEKTAVFWLLDYLQAIQSEQAGPVNNESPLGASGAKISASDLAKKHFVNADNLRKRLDRWRRDHDAGYIEVANPASREPNYLYDESAVLSVITAMKAIPAGHKRAANVRQK